RTSTTNGTLIMHGSENWAPESNRDGSVTRVGTVWPGGPVPTILPPRYAKLPVHLYDVESPEGGASQPRDSQGHLPLVLSRRENRRAGFKRRREIVAAQDHGRRRFRLHRGGPSGRRNPDRVSPPGADARPGQRRPRQRRRGGAIDSPAPHPIRGNQRPLRRAH